MIFFKSYHKIVVLLVALIPMSAQTVALLKDRWGNAVMIKEIYNLRAPEIISQVSKRFSYLSPSLPSLLLRSHREEKSREIPVCNLIAIELIFEPPSDNRLHIILRLLCVLCS